MSGGAGDDTHTRYADPAARPVMMRSAPALLAVLLLAGCGDAGDQPRRADTVTRLSDDEVKGLDPQKVSDLTSLRVAADQFEGLMRHRADGGVEPGLAARVACAPSGLECRYTLRARARFSDGQPIDAPVFAGIWRRLQDPATAAPTRSLFAAIRAIEAGDARTVIVRLNAPFPALPELLAHPALAALPLHRIAADGDRWTAERPLVTSGAYRLSDWRLGDHLTLERNPAWLDGPAPFAHVRWAPAIDKLAAMRRFKLGEADTVSDFPPTRLGWARRNLAPGTVRIAPYAGTYYLAFNTRRPPFSDWRVRRALSMAVDRAWISGRLLGTGEAPAWGVVPPALLGSDALKAPAPADPARIRALLAAAGYGPARPLVFDLRFNSGGDHRRIAVALAAMWAPYGVQARLFNTEATLHFAALRSHDFALARSGWIADLPAPENFLSVHASDAGAVNYSGNADPVFDHLLASALAQGDSAQRRAAMAAANARLAATLPVLPLFHYVSRSLVAADIGGWQDNAMNIHPSRLLFRKR